MGIKTGGCGGGARGGGKQSTSEDLWAAPAAVPATRTRYCQTPSVCPDLEIAPVTMRRSAAAGLARGIYQPANVQSKRKAGHPLLMR